MTATGYGVVEPAMPAHRRAGCDGSEIGRLTDRVDRCGYAIVPGHRWECASALHAAAFDALVDGSASGSRRVLPSASLVGELLAIPAVEALATRLVGRHARPVRAIAFDKTSAANWLVPWHQDRTIAVKRRDDAAPVRNWTVKDEVVHCEPSPQFLERMLTLRWHFDAIGRDDGCMRVLPGTQALGRLAHEEIATQLRDVPPVDAIVSAGAIFLMRPLLVHSSRRRISSGRRRVLHVEIAAGEPPAPLQWAWA